MFNATIELGQPKPDHNLFEKVKAALTRMGQDIACKAQLFADAQGDTTSSGFEARFFMKNEDGPRKE